ncbi:MAG: thiamine pyrophosphate-binding protein [Symploca sp. SIO3C6]|nr:thiamine pyrophosphate-binding protein [Symploca sp. SIO3C6]
MSPKLHTTSLKEYREFNSSQSSIVSPVSLVGSDNKNFLSSQPSVPLSVSEAVVEMLARMGIKYAFGVSGGAIAPLWHTLQHSSIEVLHFRHESGAAFAAVEAYFASGHPVVVFTTTGPGITNALTGLFAAQWEGAKVIFLSPSTSAPQRGRQAFQETSAYTMSNMGILTSGRLFNYATILECSTQLPEVARRLTFGLRRLDSFVAHLSIPTAIQTSSVKTSLPGVCLSHAPATVSEDAIARCTSLLSQGSFAIWVGFGARKSAAAIRQLAEKTGAAVMCSPRGKGIFPEDHPQFVGVTGFGGHASVLKYMQEQPPLRTLVLGTRLSELTSFWNTLMIPSGGFIHVDIDPEVPGTAYPEAVTFSIQSEAEKFVKALLKYFPEPTSQLPRIGLPRPERHVINPSAEGPVRPEVLMHLIQLVMVEGSNTVVMAEPGNSLAWATHHLRFNKPNQYRGSTRFSSMGHTVTGVVGAALARNAKTIAIVGDGAMLMNNEVSTAVRYQIPAVWIILNDGGYNMCKQGMALLDYKGVDAEIPQADFARFACSMGADGIRVEKESDIQAALEKAMASTGPFVVDVVIDSTQSAPIGSRIQSLNLQGTRN